MSDADRYRHTSTYDLHTEMEAEEAYLRGLKAHAPDATHAIEQTERRMAAIRSELDRRGP